MPAALDTVTTSRLRAERLTVAHFPDIRQMDQNPLFMAQLGGVRDEKESHAYLARNLTHWAEHGFGLYIVHDAGDGQVLGRACLRHLNLSGTDEVEVGYGFYPEVWGRGLATEIARAFVALGFERLGLTTVVALTLEGHHASQRVMLKAGLRYERDLLFDGRRQVLFRGVRVVTFDPFARSYP